MTARIDLAVLEQRARSIMTIFAGCETNGRVRVPATDVLALIAAVRALRVMFEAGHANLIGVDPNTLEHGNLVGFPLDDRDRAKRFCAVLNDARAALAAFDFKEETK